MAHKNSTIHVGKYLPIPWEWYSNGEIPRIWNRVQVGWSFIHSAASDQLATCHALGRYLCADRKVIGFDSYNLMLQRQEKETAGMFFFFCFLSLAIWRKFSYKGTVFQRNYPSGLVYQFSGFWILEVNRYFMTVCQEPPKNRSWMSLIRQWRDMSCPGQGRIKIWTNLKPQDFGSQDTVMIHIHWSVFMLHWGIWWWKPGSI